MKILKKSSLCTLPNYSENKERLHEVQKLIIFETPGILNENIVESFWLRECGRIGSRCRSFLVKSGALSYHGDIHIMPVF